MDRQWEMPFPIAHVVQHLVRQGMVLRIVQLPIVPWRIKIEAPWFAPDTELLDHMVRVGFAPVAASARGRASWRWIGRGAGHFDA